MKFFAIIFAIFALVSSALAVKNDVCALEHSADGNGLIRCAAFIPSWSYDSAKKECVEFVYGGCGGNLNRFDSLQECEKKCKE
ncbi:male accessory gland serine protease inhibitor-like [Cochliomyia hominivorax]